MSRHRPFTMPAPERFACDHVDGDTWAEFVVAAVGRTPFSEAAWIDAATGAAGTRPRFWGAFRDGRLVAGVAGGESGRGRRRRFATPDLLPHTGFLFRPATSHRSAHVESERVAATTALQAHLRETYGRVHLTHDPALVDARPFLWAGWEVTPRYTYRIDLPQRPQDLWDRFERRTRTAVRKAEKAGYTVEPAADAGELRRLYGAVYGDESAAPVSSAVVQALAGQVLAAGRARGWRCRAADGATAAVVLFVEDGDLLYAWVAGADPAHRHSGAASLLYWKVLETTPCTRFDFVGANLPSVALFKRGFGGDLVAYYATAGYRSRWLRAAHRCRSALRPI